MKMTRRNFISTSAATMLACGVSLSAHAAGSESENGLNFITDIFSDPAKPGTTQDATPLTAEKNAEWYSKLDFSDRREFGNAERGMLDNAEETIIYNDDGTTAWDLPSYGDLSGDAPDTVNPSLWRNTQLNAKAGLYEVCNGIYQVRGFDMSNATFIRTDNGWIIFDVLMCRENMNCVNYVKKTVCMVLMLAFVLISCLGAFATSENPKKLGILASSIKITDTKVEYIEYKDDGAYFVEETISGNIITSDFYKISNGEKIHSSQIISSVSGKNVISRETDANGQVTTYSVKGIVSRDTNEKSIVPYAIRTDNYSISLVGKKVTIASAAMAITLVSNYIPTTGAEDIIKKAIVVVAGAVGAGVACLPDYLYVTSVLSMHKSVGKIYYVYENDYYLDSNKSQLIGHWTFRHRSGH